MKREFYVDTPLGKLKVWAKHETDTPEDYPGVYIDFVKEGKSEELLACVEYVHFYDRIKTCVYQPNVEEPVAIISHDLEGEGEE